MVLIQTSGDRVGWGYTTDSCGACSQCRFSRFSACESEAGPTMYGTGNFDTDAFSSGVVLREPYLFAIPQQLSSANAAPMMCAGSTVWGPLTLYGAESTDCVGIIGIGGLGHLTIQFAAKLGCEVVAFSGSEAKRDDALALGAKHYIAVKGAAKIELPRKLDHLIITAGSMPDWNLFVPAMASGCSIYPLLLTAPDASFALPHMLFLFSSLRIVYPQGSTTSSYKQMLKFAALHGIKPTIEKFAMSKDGIEHSLKKLQDGKMRYRGVLCVEGNE